MTTSSGFVPPKRLLVTASSSWRRTFGAGHFVTVLFATYLQSASSFGPPTPNLVSCLGHRTHSGFPSQRSGFGRFSTQGRLQFRNPSLRMSEKRNIGTPGTEDANQGRRRLLSTAALAGATFLGVAAEAASGGMDLTDEQWWVFPLAPYQTKKTVTGQVWALDQLLGALYVHVPLRSTVLKIDGGLFVYNTVAPTQECIQLVRELEAEHGPVRYVLLASSAIEHKRTAGPFARAFPGAQLWVTPDQYSFPLGLDNVGLLGYTQLFWGTKPQRLPSDSREGGVPWGEELQHLVLGPLKSNAGKSPGLFEDVALLHKASGTLLVTDIVQTVARQIPEVLSFDPRALLFHARDNVGDRVEDTPGVRERGWERIQLFSLFFQPGGLDVIPWGQAIPEMSQGRMNELGWGGLFPFVWRPKGSAHPPEKTFWEESFAALEGRCFVPAILQTLILDREPRAVLAFADQISTWDFQRVVPAHLMPEISASPAQFRDAFRFLEPAPPSSYPGDLDSLPLSGDAQFLRDISDAITRQGVVGRPDPAVEDARRQRRQQAGLPAPAPRTGDGWGPFRN